jgi:histidinol-phosphate/aromatic aminotransferase/cobyric acid decarboxylase-like protein
VATRLREARILVRHFTVPGLDEFLRITVGDARATDRVLAAVSALDG